MNRFLSVLLYVLALLFAALLMQGCVATTLENVWKEDAYSGRLERVLILGVTKNRSVRQLYESELSRLLQAQGVNAIPSFSLFDADAPADKKAIIAKAQQQQLGHVIVTQVLDVKTYRERITDINRRYYPDDYLYSRYYRTYRRPIGWYDNYWYGYTTVRSYDVEYLVAHAETNLYLLKDEKLIWSVLSITESGADWVGSVKELAGVIVKQLGQDGLY
ncbi:MAG: hypothetical protein RQ754_07710 [Desulfuromonadales bacterium]|nr:hypothetical protein [Desulfuromonadales bacterium]